MVVVVGGSGLVWRRRVCNVVWRAKGSRRNTAGPLFGWQAETLGYERGSQLLVTSGREGQIK